MQRQLGARDELADVVTAMLPEHLLLAGIVVLIVPRDRAGPAARRVRAVALAAVAAAAAAAVWLRRRGYAGAPFPGSSRSTPAASLAKAIVLALAVPVLLISRDDFARARASTSLLLSSLYGVCLLLSADSFLTLFLGLELMSLPVYVLVLLAFRRPESAEAALKYLVLGGTGTRDAS